MWLPAWLAALAACDGDTRRCHFGAEHAIFESSAGTFDDLALVPHAGGLLAVFSDANGLYARELDERGLPRARVQRLAAGCEAGMAAAHSGERAWLACARRPAADGGEGKVSVYTLEPGAERVETRGSLGPVGVDSQRVAIDVRSDSVAVAWQDAAIGGAKIWYAPELTAPPRLLSDSSWHASAPGLFAQGPRRWALWAESRERGRVYESRTRLLDLSAREPITVATGSDGLPSPELVGTPDDLWLAFRDHRKSGKKTGLYLTRLGRDGRRTGPIVRVGRADGVGRPVLERCFGGLIAATPRTFAGDYFVGLVHIDPSLEHLSPEQQFYEDSHEYAQVAASCLDDLNDRPQRLQLLIAERGRLGANRAVLRSVGFSCE